MKKILNGIEYERIDPTGNITALVRTTVGEDERADIAKMIMEDDASCEQVGFLLPSSSCDIGLYMAAGEFCGNATMSAAAVYAMDAGISEQEEILVSVESSGVDDPVQVYITRQGDHGDTHIYNGSVVMPLPVKITRTQFEYEDKTYELPTVYFDGIAHVIAYNTDLSLPDKKMESALKIWCDKLCVKGLGLMLVTGEHDLTIRPLVYVPDVDSLFWESSCASGTTAAAAYLYETNGRDALEIRAEEPGGTLGVKVQKNGHILLMGKVRI